MSTKHTPGPWGFEICRDTGVDGVAMRFEIHQRHMICASQSAEHLLDSHPNADPLLADECEANARLIAAAPDLLKALETILPLAREALSHPDLSVEILDAIVALKKARGEA